MLRHRPKKLPPHIRALKTRSLVERIGWKALMRNQHGLYRESLRLLDGEEAPRMPVLGATRHQDAS
jgi:hypothetical protein